MDKMAELIWSLQAKSFRVHSYNSEGEKGEWFINIIIDKEEICGWQNLLERLNNVFSNPYNIIMHSPDGSGETLCTIIFNTNPQQEEKLQKEIEILTQCVLKDEYQMFPQASNNVFDIKLGVSCNNNCVHCVIKPTIYRIKECEPDSVVLDSGIGMQCSSDLSFMKVTEILTGIPEDVGVIVLTGGEPTIRKDFISIVKWIYYNRLCTNISLQTNGRNLSDINLVKAIRRYSRNPSFAVAMHGMEETHNKVVNNRKETGNPFSETVQGIKNLYEVFGKDYKDIRTEIVMSSYNIDEIYDTVRFHYEDLGVKMIGISYPHLADFSLKDVKRLSPEVPKVLQTLKLINQYMLKHDDLRIIMEEIPFCLYNKLEDEIRLESFETKERRNIRVNYIGTTDDDFNSNWIKDHSKFKKCKNCVLNNDCIGVWAESRALNEEYIEPISNLSPHLRSFIEKCWGEVPC